MKALILKALDGTMLYLGLVKSDYTTPQRTSSGEFCKYLVLDIGQVSCTSNYTIQNESGELYKINTDTRELEKL